MKETKKNAGFWNWFDGIKPKLAHRAETFRLMFEYLEKFDRPVTIIETGCARDWHDTEDKNWALDGRSTVLFDRFVQSQGGEVISVDISKQAIARCSAVVSDKVHLIEEYSVSYLKSVSEWKGPDTDLTLDLLYLDSFDFEVSDPIPSAAHHLNELMAIRSLLLPETLVVVDDSPTTVDTTLLPRPEVVGKGSMVSLYAQSVGADLLFSAYQCGWTGMVAKPGTAEEAIEALVARARAHVEAGRNVNADAVYRLILGRTTPPHSGRERVAHGEACLFYARLAMSKSKFGAAADWYREAIQADPLALDYRTELCVRAYLPMGAYTLAQQEATRAVRIDPGYAEGWHVLGGVEHELGDGKAVVAAYDRQLELLPEDPDALLDRATIALDLADYAKVTELCQIVLGTERRADATHCLAMVAYREGRHEDAIVLYDHAIAAECRDAPTAHWNKSLALHSIGRYREGWIEHEYRSQQKFNAALSLPTRRFTLPMWKGEPAPARIHVHFEAGMGDNLCMARYLPMLAERGYDVRYEADEKMVDLIRLSMPQITVVPKAPDYPGALGIQPFDYHLPVGSLPAVFGTDIDTVPWNGPYLKADPKLVDQYRAKLRGFNGRRKIGLCWSSGIRSGLWISEYGRRKSMALKTMGPLLRDGMFVSLQVGPERAECIDNQIVFDVLPEKPSWSDTAALIECLDLVITVDTSVAHLAGAMGKPVWLLMHCEGSWHFLAERPGAFWNERSPWYPSTRIVRQKTAHKWDGVIARVAADLESWQADRAA